MFSVIIGYVIGHLIARAIIGLPVLALYGIGAGLFTANVTYRDSAVLTVPLLAIVGYLLARGIRWLRNLRAERT